jgi:hypothetical protein
MPHVLEVCEIMNLLEKLKPLNKFFLKLEGITKMPRQLGNDLSFGSNATG